MSNIPSGRKFNENYMYDKINEICNELRKHYAILDKHTYITIRDKEPKQEFPMTISKDREDIGVDINSDVADPELTRENFLKLNKKHIIKHMKIQ